MAPGPPTVGWPLASRPRPLRAQDLFAPKTSSRPRPLRAQDLFAPKTSSRPRPQSQQAHVTCVGCGAFIMPKTSSSPRPLRGQDLFEAKTARHASALPSLGLQRGCGKRVIRFRHAARSAKGIAFTWVQVCPFAWKEPRQYVERIERWRPRFGGREYHISPFHGTKRTCSLAGCGAAPHDLLAKTRGGVWGSAPRALGENKRRGVGQRPTNPW